MFESARCQVFFSYLNKSYFFLKAFNSEKIYEFACISMTNSMKFEIVLILFQHTEGIKMHQTKGQAKSNF